MAIISLSPFSWGMMWNFILSWGKYLQNGVVIGIQVSVIHETYTGTIFTI
jgi:hypothetical protein